MLVQLFSFPSVLLLINQSPERVLKCAFWPLSTQLVNDSIWTFHRGDKFWNKAFVGSYFGEQMGED